MRNKKNKEMGKYYSKIHVQYKSGQKAIGMRVMLSFWSGVTKTVRTDRNGTALVEHASTGSAKILVDGTIRTTIKAPGETVVFI